ncbi:MAG: carbon-nitrogen hydrolase family protein [Desulfamplus sp.]
MKIGLAQIDCLPEDREKNISKFNTFAAQAKSEGCDVVAFPEMSDTGYITSLIPESAQTWSGSAYKQASSAARSNAINLVCGISEKRDSAIYNSVACFDPAGQLIAHYRKIHLFSPAPVHEDRVFKAGDKICTAQIGGLKWGISICFDLRFPEIYRYQTVQGAEILLNCTAWPNIRSSHWEHLTRARAIENQAFFVGAARVGTDGDLTFNGHSRIVSPSGEIIVDGSSNKEELVVGDIDIESLINFRNAIPAISLRRDDIYGNFNIISPIS